MTRRSIGFRLTLWYSAILLAALLAFGAGTWLALRHSLYLTMNETLRDRVRGVQRFIEEQGASLAPEEMRDEFREHSVLGPGGDLFQVCDSQGRWLYRSDPLAKEDLAIRPAATLAAGPRYETLAIAGVPARVLSARIEVRGQPYAVEVAAPMEELNEALRAVFWILVAAIPAVLAIASLGGFWVSRRALRPVDEITSAAQSIGAQNLSRRLAVPHSGDALERLSATLNAMFERLEGAFSRITRFTADASHELRTPVAFMKTTAEVALRRPRSEAEYRAALADILAEVERTSVLLEDLLVLARADSGASGIQRRPMDLSAILEEACGRGKVMAEAKRIHFEHHLLAQAVRMEGDPQALRRVFLILIDNAIKYTASGGRIEIGLSRRDGTASITVHDSGIGISADDLPHIFDRFYRADKARSRDSGGAGLGLSIARWIVQAHRGEITVASAAGEGSTFQVSLPASDEEKG